jgi:hypothetical protein
MEVSGMVGKLRSLYRPLGAALIGLSLLVIGPAVALADDDSFDVTGTIVDKHGDKQTWVVLTSDVGGKERPITIDMSHLSGTFDRHKVGEPITITIRGRDHDSYLGLRLVSEGSYVDGATLGTQERYQTQGSSIKAHVGNVPEDDESLNQQHRDNDLKTDQDDDDLNGNNGN